MGHKKDNQIKLNNLLRNLSEIEVKDSFDVIKYKEQLQNIYSGDFRHFYSELCETIRFICEKNGAESLQIVLECLDLIITEAKKENPRDEQFIIKIHKIYDHINLELIRFSKDELIDSRVKQAKEMLGDAIAKTRAATNELKNTKKELKTTQENLNKANEELTKATENASKLQNQVVAVLSIFSAIVISFTGGVSLLTGAFNSIAHVSLLKILILVLTIGGLLYNCIFLLLYYISKIIDKNIYSYCYRENKICISGCDKTCNIIKRTFKKLPMLVVVNVIILVAIIICSIIYLAY